MNGRQGLRLLALVMALGVTVGPVHAINILIDYTYDTSNFFGNGNPQGATAGMQARSALEAAATYYSAILNDAFSAIQTPPKFVGSNGMVTWQWTMDFNNPTNNNPIILTNQTIVADQYLVFAGARNLVGNTLGVGGPGGYGWSNNPTGLFSSAEGNQIDLITNNFRRAVEQRGELSGFARWGGTIAFDSIPPSPWHYSHLTPPSGTGIDFYSVAIHELAHTLGFGASTPWQSLVSGSFFEGGNAKIQNGGNPVPLSPDLGHWVDGTVSVVYGGTTPQEAAMDPVLQNGTRKLLTELDAAALKDIGWNVIAPPPPPAINGDYNNNGIVDAGDYVVWRDKLNQSITIPNDATPGTVTATDYTVWRRNFGRVPGGGGMAALAAVPEASAVVQAIAGAFVAAFARRKRRG